MPAAHSRLVTTALRVAIGALVIPIVLTVVECHRWRWPPGVGPSCGVRHSHRRRSRLRSGASESLRTCSSNNAGVTSSSARRKRSSPAFSRSPPTRSSRSTTPTASSTSTTGRRRSSAMPRLKRSGSRCRCCSPSGSGRRTTRHVNAFGESTELGATHGASSRRRRDAARTGRSFPRRRRSRSSTCRRGHASSRSSSATSRSESGRKTLIAF